LDFRTGVVAVVLDDGDRCVVGLEAVGVCRGLDRADLLRGSTGRQRHVVCVVFWNARSRLGVCRDLFAVGFDRHNHFLILAKRRCRRGITGPLLGLGDFRSNAQLLDLAVELMPHTFLKTTIKSGF
jgi:hypothetical protein